MIEKKFNAWNKEKEIMHQFINHPDSWSFSFLYQDIYMVTIYLFILLMI